MFIKDCMKREVVSISPAISVREAAEIFAEKRIGTLPVVNDNNQLIGLLQLRDLLTLIMPDFTQLVEDFDFVHDFGAMEDWQPSPDATSQPVRNVMQVPICVEENCGLLRAFSMLNQHRLFDLPVVDKNNVLVGIASRVDIGAQLFSTWYAPKE